MSLALYPSRVRSNKMLDLNNLSFVTVLVRRVSGELQRIFKCLAFMAGRKKESRTVTTVTHHHFINEVFDSCRVLTRNPHKLDPVLQKGFYKRIESLRSARNGVKHDLRGVRHNV